MKLTKREKILLTFLLVLLSVFLYHRFVFQPEYGKIAKLQEEYARKQRIYNQVKRKDERIIEIQNEMKKLQYDLTAMNKKIAMPIYVPEILRELDRTSAQKSVLVDSIVFSGNASAVKGEALTTASNSSVNANMSAVAAAQNMIARNDSILAEAAQSTLAQNASLQTAQSSQTKAPAGLNTLIIQISFQGSYANCIEFIKYYENNERLFRVDSFEISGTNDRSSGRASLTTFAMSSSKDPNFRYQVDTGTARTSPFR